MAGVVNTLAGGGSLLTVPLLVVVGLPGTLANGTNRVGILLQTGFASAGFWAQGRSGLRHALPVLAPACLGALIGAGFGSHLPDAVFERVFGVIMLLLLVPLIRGFRPSGNPRSHPAWLRVLVFFGIGLYAGSFQAGTGFLLLFALSFGGYDLVEANSIKVVMAFCFVALALPVFLAAGEVAWPQALCLGSGFAVGGAAGSRIAVRGGEKIIRPVLAVAVVALAIRMFGLY